MAVDIDASSTFTMLANMAGKEPIKSSDGSPKVASQEQQPSKILTPKKPSPDMGFYLSQMLSPPTKECSPMEK